MTETMTSLARVRQAEIEQFRNYVDSGLKTLQHLDVPRV